MSTFVCLGKLGGGVQRMAARARGSLLHLAWVLLLAVPMAVPVAHAASAAPSSITVGCLYAKTGFLSYQSMKLHEGLEFWKNRVDHAGGVYVKAYGKRLPVKFKCYNDRSDPGLVSTLINKLVDDKVDVLVSDTSSFLTAPAVPLARAHKMLLINPVGTSRKFYTPGNPYIVQTSDLVTRYWSQNIARLLLHLKVKRVAILYGTNDFDGPQAQEVKHILHQHGIKPVYYNAVPTKTSNYTVLLHRIASSTPQAVLELGYDPNDVRFLKDLKQGGFHFPLVYTLFPAFVPKEFSGMAKELAYTYTFVTAPDIKVSKINYGLTTKQFVAAFKQRVGHPPDAFQAGGYIAGLVIQKALATSDDLSQLGLRHAIADFSGKLRTLGGTFRITSDGAQTGVVTGVGQFLPGKSGLELHTVYPAKYATAKPVYPAPQE